jgi:FAD:protein FMN transferase
MIRHCQPALGTQVEISISGNGGSARALQKEAAKAFQLIRSVQHMTAFHEPESDVFRLNQCAHIAPLRVHPWTWQVLEQSLRLCEETAGAFDITVAPQVIKPGASLRHRPFTTLVEAGAWRHVELLPDCQVRFHEQLQLDLSGIAKHFAVDKAIDFLETRGVSSAAITADGDRRVLGLIEETADPAARQHPAIMLRPAVVTAPAHIARTRLGFTRVSPVIHPRTAKPLRHNQSLSVFSRTCVEAEALAKAVLLAPQALWNRALKLHDSVALVLTARGEQVLFPV